jgi:lysophospholipase L1-like esterase
LAGEQGQTVRRTEAVSTDGKRLQPGGRRVAALTAYAGGAVTAAGALGVGVLLGQVLLARLTIPGAQAPPPRSTGEYGTAYDGPVLRLALLGDSTAAGYGTRHRDETPGALLATWIADAAQRRVRLTCPAVVGAVSAWLPVQVETVLEGGVDLAVILIGANDVTTGGGGSAAVRHLFDGVRTLREAGAEVVVATCPDLGTIRPIRRPLRWLARRWSRQLAAAQTVAVVRAGGRTVSLGDLLGPKFYAAPERMFGADRFHPSVEGYQVAANLILPSALAALGLSLHPQPVGAVRPLLDAAASAASRPGTEVSSDGVSSAGVSTTARARSRRRVTLNRRNGASRTGDAAVRRSAVRSPDPSAVRSPAREDSRDDVPSRSGHPVSPAAQLESS